MSLSFAGVALNVLPLNLRVWLESYHSLSDFEYAEVDWNVFGLKHLPRPVWSPYREPEVGTLYWPIGMSRFGHYYGVVSESRLARIRTTLGDGSAGPANLVMTSKDGGSSRTVSLLYHSARPLAQIPDTEQLYLLLLCDRRYHLRAKTGSITSTPASWSDLLSSLASQLGITLTVGSIDAAYGAPTSQWLFNEQPVSIVLDAACERIGHRLVANLDGTFQAVNVATANGLTALQTESLRRTAGGYLLAEDLVRSAPASIKTVFRNSESFTPHTVTTTLASLALPGYSGASGISGTTHTVFGELVYDGSNTSAVSAYATQAATDWYNWHLANIDLTGTSITEWNPSGVEDRVEWKYLEDRILTRIVRRPYQVLLGGFGEQNEAPDPEPTCNCDGLGWVAALTDSDCLRVTVKSRSGQCDCEEGVGQSVDLVTSDGESWDSDEETLTVCTTDYTIEFERSTGTEGEGLPKLKLLTSPSGPEFVGTFVRYGSGCALFSFGGDLCTGDPEDDPSKNLLDVQIAWIECGAEVGTEPDCGCSCDEGGIDITVGCGLAKEGDEVSVDPEQLAGFGLVVQDAECEECDTPDVCPVWYTAYHHMGTVAVKVGDVLTPGFTIGTVGKFEGLSAHSHFSLGDGRGFLSAGNPFCVVGQTLDIDGLLWSVTGTRDPGAAGPLYTPPDFGVPTGQETAASDYIESVTAAWIDGPGFVQVYGSSEHKEGDYYAVDVYPTGANPSDPDDATMLGETVKLAIAADSDVYSDVVRVEYVNDQTGSIVIVRHRRRGCCPKLDVALKCGLTFDGNALALDTAGVAGKGLTSPYTEDGSCRTLEVKPGCGVRIDESDAVALDFEQVAGAGLVVNEEGTLEALPKPARIRRRCHATIGSRSYTPPGYSRHPEVPGSGRSGYASASTP